MLPIKRRIKTESFPKIMKEGFFVHSDNFYLKILSPTSLELRGANLPPSRFGFVVPNKVKKTSVGRHLIKRRITAVVEKLLINIKSGFSVIVFAKKDVSALPYSDIEKEIKDLLIKGKLVS